ncbi:MAG: diguanylate cyclase [Mariprofundaceae bacterium]|nr:diguanylate cyclase [Mariprofundaceae bacterium]
MGLVSIVGFGQLSILDDRHYTVMICFMLNIILAVLLTLLLFKRILHPIRQLMRMADDFKSGILHERLEFNKKDELGVLGCHFIEMTEDVEILNKDLLERDALNQAYGSAVAMLSASNDREMALSEVLAMLSMHLPVFAGAVCLHEPEAKSLFLTAVHGMNDDAKAQKVFLKHVSEELESLGHMMSLKYLSDVEFVLDGKTDAMKPEYAVMFPVLYRQEKVGALVLALHQELSPAQLDFLQKLVGDMAVAIKDISRYEHLKMLNTELEKHREKLQQERDDAVEDSITDGLTRIYNRGYFDLSRKGFIQHARRNYEPLSLLLIDIDYFKAVNDTYGHPCGDEVLIRIAQVMKKSLRETDFVARYGGEEFVCVLPHASVLQARQAAEKLRVAVASQHFDGMNGKSVTISVGLSALKDDDSDLQAMVERADKSLYHAKEIGRNCVVCDDEIGKL